MRLTKNLEGRYLAQGEYTNLPILFNVLLRFIIYFNHVKQTEKTPSVEWRMDFNGNTSRGRGQKKYECQYRYTGNINMLGY